METGNKGVMRFFVTWFLRMTEPGGNGGSESIRNQIGGKEDGPFE
jgi:hypothetical protein